MFFMWLLLPYVLVCMIWYIYTLITIKEMKRMLDRGIPWDEVESKKMGRHNF